MAELPKVVVTDYIVEPLAYEREVLDGRADVVALGATTQEDLAAGIVDADAVMIYHYLSLDAKTIESLKKCQIIVRPGVGYDNIDLDAAKRAGIPVCNVPDYGTEEVADSALGMAISLAREVHFLNHRLQRNASEPWSVEVAGSVPRLRGRTFGIVGLGRIGTAAAVRAKAFGFDVVFYDPYIPDGIDKALGIRRAFDLSDLLEQVNVLSLHCPLTDETRGMIGAEEIAAMPEGGIVVNTARGGVLDTAAAVRALENGHLKGAGIDVLETEPPSENDEIVAAWRNEEHPAHDRLLLNPHSAFFCNEGEAEFRRKGAREVLRMLKGEPLRNQVG
ncbi:MAG: 2-hydroxyacid dehydrogenase [Verrucomicrobiales bacterium]|nr:2-hydroxyacid dehydrogenase [Verrucomicrobiales bacterium]